MSATDPAIVVRMAQPDFVTLRDLLFSRYPRKEWATFVRFGWRETADGLVLTLAAIDAPQAGDIDDSVEHVRLLEPYTLRMALASEAHTLAVGVVHSHPKEYWPRPSEIDDDMDGYYAEYFADFARDRPYVSLIVSEMDGELVASGRICYRRTWHEVTQFKIERTPLKTLRSRETPPCIVPAYDRVKRLADAFGREAARRLRQATVAVIGAGGTGSATIEVLARAGIGRLIIVDPDIVETSNLERIHGSVPEDADAERFKVEVAKRHVAAIDADIEVITYVGRLPQEPVLDEVLKADVVIGCTDRGYSRIALGELSWRFLVPTIDCGVSLEGGDGQVSAQVLQLVPFRGGEPCAICSNMTNPVRVSQELMSVEEREQRVRAAEEAVARGEDPNPYWTDTPQLNTVGYLTTMAGSMVAGYAIGWITGRFDAPFVRLQANLSAPLLDTTDSLRELDVHCVCQTRRGWADQAIRFSQVTAPEHWPPSRRTQ
jgi:molybdopterin/thiamine biosynthesis adenylyltransferase